MSKPVNHHYLPQFYLKGFTDPKINQLHIFQNDIPRWRTRGVKQVACVPHLYSYLDKEGERRYEIETMFSKLERHFSLVVNKVIKREPLSETEEHSFACFVMVMWQRVPSEVDHFNAIWSEIGQRIIDISYHQYTKNPEALERWKEQRRLETGENTFDNLYPENFDPAKAKVTANWHATLMTMMQAAPKLAETVCKMGWTILEATPPDCFITSDHPFSMFDPTNTSEHYGTGLKHPNVEICLPLSRNLAFFAGWRSGGRRWLPVPKKLVEGINIRTAAMADREIIAPNTGFPGYNRQLTRFYKW